LDDCRFVAAAEDICGIMEQTHQPYHNTYARYFRLRDGKVVSAVAFFDRGEFDEF
jgi:ketosteroid isomerase-like protein